MAQQVRNPPANAGDAGLIPGSEENMATHSVFLPGESHGQEPGGLQSTGSQRADTMEAAECTQPKFTSVLNYLSDMRTM